jgi:membrane-associated phospholipid phosphatase
MTVEVTHKAAPSSAGTALALLALSACAWLAACSRAPSPEPRAATWRPILLSAPDAIRLAPPPAAGSAEQQAEIAELLTLQAARTPESIVVARSWAEGGTIHWNEIARQLVAKHRASHTMASRAYALLSVAEYDALVAAMNNKYFFNRPRPAAVTPGLQALSAHCDPTYPSSQAAVAAASATVLSYLFPEDAADLAASRATHVQQQLVAGVAFRSDLAAGELLGGRIAALVIQRAQADGADARGENDADAAADAARVRHPGQPPAEPRWGNVRPWLMSSGAQFRAGPPPAPTSAEFRAALAEVRMLSDNRTPEQQRLAAVWADGLGSYAPAGRWNKTAADLIRKYHLSEVRAGRVFALLNVALMDAGIAAWETKYHYQCSRPRDLDPAITTPVEEPNSPSFTCSHAAFSGAGAAVLGYLFPAEAEALQARAQEAAMSRVYGGIQFRFEGEAGLAQGRAVAGLAVLHAQADGSQ